MSSGTSSVLSGSYQTLPQLWRSVCRERGEQNAFRHKRRGIWAGVSWKQFFEESRAIGLALSSAGIDQGDVVSILSGNRPEWLFFDFAAQSMQFVSHGIYPTDSCDQVGEVLRLAGSRAVVVEDVGQLSKVLSVRERCPDLALIVLIEGRGLAGFTDGQLVMYSELLSTGQALAGAGAERFDALIAGGSPGSVACLSPTAATTGPARLATLSQANLCGVAQSVGEWLDASAGTRSLSIVSLANAGERTLSAVAPLVTPLVVHFPESAGTVMNDLREVEPEIVFAPTRFWEHLQAQISGLMDNAISTAFGAYRRALEEDVPAWRRWLVLRNVRKRLGLRRTRMPMAGATAVAPKLLNWFAAIRVPVYEAYVVAEAGGFCSLTPVAESLSSSGMRPVKNVSLKLSADGEILIEGPTVHGGYWENGTRLNDARVGSALRTGDSGVALSSGRLQFAGRLADGLAGSAESVLVSHSFERAVKVSPYILDAVLIGRGRSYCTTLIAVDEAIVGKYARDHEIPYTDHVSLVSHPKIVELLSQQIDIVNAKLPESARIRAFRILMQSLDSRSEELTPALRLRRYVVERKYAGLVEEMYVE